MNNKIDSRPTTKIYTYFKKLSYTLQSAIPEFLDNSIASFRKNKEYFAKNKIKMNITIIFDSSSQKMYIRDNAYGMTMEEIPRAVRLQDVPEDNPKGLNEFGMGLKTAGFWLGETIDIYTKSPNSKSGLEVEMSLEKFQKGVDEIPILENKRYNEPPFFLMHGTVIMIGGVRKVMTPSSLRGFIANLGSKYRNDINTLGISIRLISRDKKGGNFFDLVHHYKTGKKKQMEKLSWGTSETLEWKKPSFWPDKQGNPYCGELSFDVTNNGVVYKVTGEIGIKLKGSRSNAGFDLLRRGRVIVEKYKNHELIGEGSGFAYQRLYASFNMDEFPVTQAKDNFDWEDGLEEQFIKTLLKQPLFKKLKKKSGELRVSSDNKKQDIDSKKYIESSKIHLSNIDKNIKTTNDHKELRPIADALGFAFHKSDVLHKLEINSGGVKIYSRVLESDSPEDWISWKKYNVDEERLICVALDMNHSFFNPFNSDPNFVDLMRLFACCFALSGNESMDGGDGILQFKERLGRYLKNNIKENQQ